MGAATISVDYAALEALADRFARCGAASAELQQQVIRRAEALSGEGWRGPGADAFAAEMSGVVLPALQRLVESLEAASAVVRELRATYSAAEEEAARLFWGPGTADAPADGDAPAGRPAPAPPQPRVYIVNGIDSEGRREDVERNGRRFKADKAALKLEEVLEAHGYEPDEVTPTAAIFDEGGWVRGSYETWTEHYIGQSGPYTRRVYEFIEADLRSNPLAPGQSIVLIGYSGGGAVTANLAGMVERRLGHDVSGMITMGSPVSNYDEARRYAEKIVDVRHANDPVLGYGALRSAPIYTPFRPPPEGSTVRSVPLTRTVPWNSQGEWRYHGSYMYYRSISGDMVRALRREFPEMQLQEERIDR